MAYNYLRYSILSEKCIYPIASLNSSLSLYSTVNKLKKETAFSGLSCFNVNNDKSQCYPTADHLRCLQSQFRFKRFKSIQWSIIKSVLDDKRDNFAIMPSGYGKSLCYQFPAVYTKGLSIVISPLISLMQDQVNYLQSLGIAASFLGPAQVDKYVIYKLFQGFYRVIYMTPETAVSNYGIRLLEKLYNELNITLVAIDEAHCAWQWGNEFRPAYGKLDLLKLKLPTVPILALTATATKKEKFGIVNLLGLRDPNVLNTGYNRENLFFCVRQKSKEPYGDISEVLFVDRKKLSIDEGSVIIYCITRKYAEKIANLLNKMDIDCQVYHSGMCNEDRKSVMNNFMNGKVKVIVATTAFGMGINKADVRVVIHYGTSLSMEGYYQEVGRAGRDGKPALCVLYYSPTDFIMHRYISITNSQSTINFDDSQMRNLIMKKYATSTLCRRKFILEYFDKNYSDNTPPVHPCCDNCLHNHINTENLYDVTSDAELLLKGISSFYPISYGMNTVIAFLMGNSKNNSLTAYKNNEIYGMGAKRNEEWWKQLGLLLELENYITFTSKIVGSVLYTKVILDIKGKQWLRDKTNGIHVPIKLKLTRSLQKLLKQNTSS